MRLPCWKRSSKHKAPRNLQCIHPINVVSMITERPRCSCSHILDPNFPLKSISYAGKTCCWKIKLGRHERASSRPRDGPYRWLHVSSCVVVRFGVYPHQSHVWCCLVCLGFGNVDTPVWRDMTFQLQQRNGKQRQMWNKPVKVTRTFFESNVSTPIKTFCPSFACEKVGGI